MKNLLQFLMRFSNFLIFLILEVVAFILIVTNNHYQQSSMYSSANHVVAGIQQIQTTISDYFQLREHNHLLAEENAYLKQQLMMQANALEKELEQDSQYVYSHLMWQYIPAKVIHATTHKQHNYLTINKCKRDGIEVDMGVLSHDGVVGIVTAVSEKYALVVPTIHTEMNLSCRLKKNNCVGRTQWMGRNCQEVALKDISRHISVEEGDTVVTSGLTSIFPEGIAVGIVTATALHEGDNYHQTTLQLTTDYQSIKYVQVIHNLSHNENDSILWSGLNK